MPVGLIWTLKIQMIFLQQIFLDRTVVKGEEDIGGWRFKAQKINQIIQEWAPSNWNKTVEPPNADEASEDSNDNNPKEAAPTT